MLFTISVILTYSVDKQTHTHRCTQIEDGWAIQVHVDAMAKANKQPSCLLAAPDALTMSVAERDWMTLLTAALIMEGIGLAVISTTIATTLGWSEVAATYHGLKDTRNRGKKVVGTLAVKKDRKRRSQIGERKGTVTDKQILEGLSLF